MSLDPHLALGLFFDDGRDLLERRLRLRSNLRLVEVKEHVRRKLDANLQVGLFDLEILNFPREVLYLKNQVQNLDLRIGNRRRLFRRPPALGKHADHHQSNVER